jgi:hypothetical protein
MMQGYGAPTDDAGDMSLDGLYQKTFSDLAPADADADKILGVLRDHVAAGNLTEQEYQGFFAYAKSRIENERRYNVEPGNAEGVKYRTPEEYMVALGLKRGE